MGDAGGQGGSAARLTTELRAAYDAAAEWAGGPEQMYARLAGALVAASPVPLAGRSVLDLGAGTGVAGRSALAAGARLVVAADLATGMLRRAGPAQKLLGGGSFGVIEQFHHAAAEHGREQVEIELPIACGSTPSTPKSPSTRTASYFMQLSNPARGRHPNPPPPGAAAIGSCISMRSVCIVADDRLYLGRGHSDRSGSANPDDTARSPRRRCGAGRWP